MMSWWIVAVLLLMGGASGSVIQGCLQRGVPTEWWAEWDAYKAEARLSRQRVLDCCCRSAELTGRSPEEP